MIGPTVYIVDDDRRILRAVSRLLRSHHFTVRSYSDVTEFLSQKLPQEPACILLDLRMPEITGLDLQQILAGGNNHLPIIFLSGEADIDSSVRAMKAGAVDFLTKPFQDHELLSAIEKALSLSRDVLAKQDELKKDQTAFTSLTPREQDVCLRIAQGLLNKQVGFELGTTEKTIKVQRARVMQKLGADSLPDVVRFVERLKIAGALPRTIPGLGPKVL